MKNEKTTEKSNAIHTLIRLIGYAAQTGALWLLIFLFLLIIGSEIGLAQVLGKLMPAVLNASDRLPMLCVLLAVFYFLTSIISSISGLLQRYIRENAARNFRLLTAERMIRADYEWVRAQKTGDLVGRMNEDIKFALAAVSDFVPQFIKRGLMLIIICITLIWIDWRIAAVFCILSSLVFIAQRVGGNKKNELVREWLLEKGTMNARVQDIIRNRSTIKAYQIEGQARALSVAASDAYTRKGARGISYMFASLTPMHISTALPFLGLCLVGAILIVQGSLDAEKFMMAVYLGNLANNELEGLPNITLNLPQFIEGGKRLFAIWDAPIEPSGSYTGARWNDDGTNPILTLNDVTFGYSDKMVLDQFSLTVDKGEQIAMVGASGSGKSTVFKLITGLYEADLGNIEFMGGHVRLWDKDELRSRICVITQDPFLFPGSLRENITCGRQVSQAQIEQIIGRVGLTEHINSLPQGLETAAGELGTQLSGGQRQRITLARAIVQDTQVLLLDEATAALDAMTEQKVIKTFRDISTDKTVLWIAHRLSSIRWVDRIIMIDNGKVIETGTHEGLMEKQGSYYKLYTTQEREAQRHE